MFPVKTKDFLYQNRAKCSALKLCAVFCKKHVLEQQFECKARIVLVGMHNWFRRLVGDVLQVRVFVSQIPEKLKNPNTD